MQSRKMKSIDTQKISMFLQANREELEGRPAKDVRKRLLEQHPDLEFVSPQAIRNKAHELVQILDGEGAYWRFSKEMNPRISKSNLEKRIEELEMRISSLADEIYALKFPTDREPGTWGEGGNGDNT